MKKMIIPLILILILTGCSRVKNTDNYVEIVNTIIGYNNKKVNNASYGYNYYLPVGVNLIYDGKYNKEIKVKDNKLMLYVDIVSYYYKNNLNYELDNKNDNYYYNKFNNGYIVINKEEDTYYLKIVYNYAKIESYVKKDDLIDIISYSTIILNSISYNDTLIDNIILKGENYSNEITYEINKPNDSSSKFSEYLQEYVQENNEEENNDILPEE